MREGEMMKMSHIINSDFTKDELELAKELAYENMEKDDGSVGFIFNEIWITNPFLESTGRLEFTELNSMYDYYGMENVNSFINKLLGKV